MSEKIDIQTEFTPNPNSLKFNVGRSLLDKGSLFFETPEAAKGASPMAEKLFGIQNVASVLIGVDFVTITRDTALETWGPLIAPVTKELETFLASGQPVVNPEAVEAGEKKPTTDIEKKIIQILDSRIRPAIARDGGDIVFHGFKNGVVTLHLQGACTTCPSSVATLKAGVERMLTEYVPEVKEVVQV